MLSDILDIEELRTADSVGEANRLLQEGWDLIGFHPAPPEQSSVFSGSKTVFVLARLADDEYADELELEDLETDEFEPLSS